jgi:hypothetical protein
MFKQMSESQQGAALALLIPVHDKFKEAVPTFKATRAAAKTTDNRQPTDRIYKSLQKNPKATQGEWGRRCPGTAFPGRCPLTQVYRGAARGRQYGAKGSNKCSVRTRVEGSRTGKERPPTVNSQEAKDS